ncbi:hypothetical protein NQ315_001581 [Exocentrus adspersus]|uniref:Protein-lysine N-methyltransferase SMYD4 n=1 Tax=Exocentrus adspersus TaxID=1586481 RepID=A0AAV8W8Z1_9CUCU|nr:hypothetical protein NQ315_001581 [Exocentrus adspersus]
MMDADGIVAELLRLLGTKRRVAEVSKEFSTKRTNAERARFAYRLLEAHELLPALGNEMFKAKKNGEAIKLYTHSVALAQEGAENLALAYANRSAVLFEERFYEECLLDIDRALANNYPDNLKMKLLSRQEKAKQLKAKQAPRAYHEPIPEIPEDHRNKRIQCASDAIKIHCTETQGRHVIATRDVAPGEILVVEKPFCHILLEQFYNHCHECLELCYNLIPCTGCTQVLYCSDKCGQDAVAYHKYECRILATVKKLKMDKLKLLPMKIALLVKDKYSTIADTSTADACEDDTYCSDRYKEIHNLIPNTSKRLVADLFDRAATAAIIFHLIKKFTDFFQNDEEETVFQELVLLHMQTGACNFHEITELAENQDDIYSPEELGAGAYSFLSMFNHRCSPNVVRNCYGAVIVMRAVESIKKGEQCYDNYGYHHAVMPKTTRQAKLKRQYFFDCTCEVCTDNWPLYLDLPKIKTDVRVLEGDIFRLQQGDVETAKRVLWEILPKLKGLEEVKPNISLAEIQEVVKQCYGLLANVRRTM